LGPGKEFGRFRRRKEAKKNKSLQNKNGSNLELNKPDWNC